MKRIFLTFPLLFFLLQGYSQGLYVKFNGSVRLDPAGIRTVPGEILPVTPDRKHLLLWEDTLELPSGSWLFLSDTAVNDLSGKKNEFVKGESAGLIRIDLNTLAPLSDTAYFVCGNGNRIPLFTKTTMQQPLSSCGNKFRLVIPGIPTLFYTADDLVQPVPAPGITDTADTDQPVTWNLFRLADRHKIALGIFLMVLIAAVLIFKYRKKIRKRFSRKRNNFPGPSARSGFYGHSEGDGKKNENDEEMGRMRALELQEFETMAGEGKLHPEFRQTRQFLQAMESRILHRIDSIQNGQNDITKLNEKFDLVSREKAELEESLGQLKNEKQQLQQDLDLIRSRVIRVDFLRNYCEAVSGIFELCHEIVKTAYDQYRYKMNSSPENAEIIGQFLLKFEYKKPPVVGKWEQIVHDIRESGNTPNAELIRSFRQIGSEEEKIREFKRQIFDVLMEYTSAVLVLAEELKNFSRFALNGYDGAHETESVFSGLVNEMLNKVKTAKLEMRYVPLFVKNAKYSNLTKVVNQRPGRVYNAVIDKLDKDTVAEIVAFGFESEFGKTETQVILS